MFPPWLVLITFRSGCGGNRMLMQADTPIIHNPFVMLIHEFLYLRGICTVFELSGILYTAAPYSPCLLVKYYPRFVCYWAKNNKVCSSKDLHVFFIGKYILQSISL